MMKANLSFLCHSRRSESGSASVEFSFIGVLLLISTLGILELGRIIHTNHLLVSAVSGVIRLVRMGATNDDIVAAIRGRFPAGDQAAVTVEIAEEPVGGVNYMRIDAQIELPLIIPDLGIFPQNAIPVRTVLHIPLN